MICTGCGQDKPLEAFPKRSSTGQPRNPCSACKKAKQRQKAKEHAERNKALGDAVFDGPDKACSKCREVKPRRAFYPNAYRADGLDHRCIPCARAAGVPYHENHRKYGLSRAAYHELAESQGFACAICRQPCATGRRLAVDHDHHTGKVRGLLCTSCNLVLGKMQDDPDRLRAAADYLERA